MVQRLAAFFSGIYRQAQILLEPFLTDVIGKIVRPQGDFQLPLLLIVVRYLGVYDALYRHSFLIIQEGYTTSDSVWAASACAHFRRKRTARMVAILTAPFVMVNSGYSTTASVPCQPLASAHRPAHSDNSQNVTDSLRPRSHASLTPMSVAAASAKIAPHRAKSASPLRSHTATPVVAAPSAKLSVWSSPFLSWPWCRAKIRPTMNSPPATCVPDSAREYDAPLASCDKKASSASPIRKSHAQAYGSDRLVCKLHRYNPIAAHVHTL